MIRLPGIGMIGLVLVLSSTGDLSAQANAAKADFVLVNGKIWTVNKAQPEAEALAVWQGRILAVGFGLILLGETSGQEQTSESKVLGRWVGIWKTEVLLIAASPATAANSRASRG